MELAARSSPVNATVKNPVTYAINSPVTFTLTVLDLTTGCSSSDSMTISLGGVNTRPIAMPDYDTTIVNGPVTLMFWPMTSILTAIRSL